MSRSGNEAPGLTIPRALWARLIEELKARTEGEQHESGAFLLGHRDEAGRHVSEALYFEDLHPGAYDRGIVDLPSSAFRELWSRIRGRGLQVVADIHVHPESARQSDIDQKNPLIAVRGHVAIILPNFARTPVRRWSIGVYEYLGDHRWTAHGGCRSTFLALEDDHG